MHHPQPAADATRAGPANQTVAIAYVAWSGRTAGDWVLPQPDPWRHPR